MYDVSDPQRADVCLPCGLVVFGAVVDAERWNGFLVPVLPLDDVERLAPSLEVLTGEPWEVDGEGEAFALVSGGERWAEDASGRFFLDGLMWSEHGGACGCDADARALAASIVARQSFPSHLAV